MSWGTGAIESGSNGAAELAKCAFQIWLARDGPDIRTIQYNYLRNPIMIYKIGLCSLEYEYAAY